MEKLPVCVIGCGERGETILRILREKFSDRIIVAYAIDTDPARRKAISEKYGVSAYSSWAYALEHAMLVRAAFIATNPPLHCEQVEQAAMSKCHIFCEKPLALSPEEADRMTAAVRKAGVVCTVDFETVFADSFQVLKAALSEEWFGKLLRFDATDKGRPPAYDMETCMPHFLHAMMILTGSRPVEVFGRVIVDGRKATLDDVVPMSELYPQGRTHDIGMRADTIEASYLFKNGVTARFFLSQLDEDYVVKAGKSANKPGSEFMNFIVYGTRGQVKFHQTQTGFVYRKEVPQDTLSVMDWESIYTPSNPDPTWIVPTTRLIKNFLDVIDNGGKPITSIEDAARVVEQTVGIYASHLAGRPLKLPLENRIHPCR